MDVRCDRCQTEYELEDETVAEGGASVQCTSCGHTFVVSRRGKPSTPTPPPVPVEAGAPASWMLTTEEGKTHRFRDPTTLQKWIVERRVGRNDRVCPPGGSWRRLSDMDELRPFFDVVDQADRTAAAARGSRPTQPETPARKSAAAAYASPDDDDDDVTSGRRSGGGRAVPSQGRSGGYPSRLDSEVTAGVANRGYYGAGADIDDGLDTLMPAKRSGPKLVAGVVFVGAAAAAAYFGFNGFGALRGTAKREVAGEPSAAAPVVAAPKPVLAPPPAAAPAAPTGATASAAPSPPAAPPAPAAAPSAPAPTAAPPAVKVAAASPGDDTGGADPGASQGRHPVEGTRPGARAASVTTEAPGRSHSYEQLVADGDRALENGNTVKAQKLFDEALKLQPDGVAAVTGSGYLLLDRQRPLAAIGMFKRALASAPSFPQALFGLGEAYRSQGQPAAAIEAYRTYLNAAPGGPDAPAARRQLRELESQAAPAKRAVASPPDDTTPTEP